MRSRQKRLEIMISISIYAQPTSHHHGRLSKRINVINVDHDNAAIRSCALHYVPKRHRSQISALYLPLRNARVGHLNKTSGILRKIVKGGCKR